MSVTQQDGPEELLQCFQRATEELRLCPNRVWAIARDELPFLLPASNCSPVEFIKENQDHELCTWDFCEYSRRDFTAVEQRHECATGDCLRLSGRFSRSLLDEAALNGNSTAWNLEGNAILNRPLPYMAVSHVWSDGTGAGAWGDLQVNSCLYAFFQDIARGLQCEGIWWDTVCIPREKAARTRAIRMMQQNYQNARVTLVHDCFIRNWTWDPETACFGILMSPWFSRGWTALELANSPKVKFLFKGSHGEIVIKDLDEEILSKVDDQTQGPRQKASQILRLLRNNFDMINQDVNGLLTILGPRFTSWPKDMAIISALLTGSEINELQQVTYGNILRKLGRLYHGHLFHNTATMRGISWCPTTLFDMPQQPLRTSTPYLIVRGDGSLHGEWRIMPVKADLNENILWESNIHPLIKRRLELALDQTGSCRLLAEPGTKAVSKALLVTKNDRSEPERPVLCTYVGTIIFRQHVPNDQWETQNVQICGNSTAPIEQSNAGVQTMKPKTNEHHTEESHPGALHEAVWQGKYAKVVSMVEYQDVTIVDQRGQNVLHLAAERGDVPMVQLLLDKGPSLIGSKCANGQTPLHKAAWSGSEAVVKLFLAKSAHVLATDNDGNTPIHITARMGFTTIVDVLLHSSEGRHCLDLQGCNGLTLLHLAAINGSEDMVSMLLAAGCDLAVEDLFGRMPLHYAASTGNANIVTMLEYQKPGAAAPSKIGWTPLHIAAMSGHEHLVVKLLEDNEHANAADWYGWTPQHFAGILGHESIAKLLAHTRNPANRTTKVGWSPLHVMVMEKPVRLFQSVAEGTIHDKQFSVLQESCNPLIYAAENGLSSAVQCLVAKRVSRLDVEDSSGHTPLELASNKGHDLVVQSLIKAGAKMDGQKFQGSFVLCKAVENAYESVITVLLDNGLDVNGRDKEGLSPLMVAGKYGRLSVIDLLIEKGSEVNAKSTYDQWTAIKYAAWHGHPSAVKLLVKKGGDIEATDKQGFTPLLAAAVYQQWTALKVLAENGANIQAVNSYQETAIWFAVTSGAEDSVELLIARGADVHAKNKLGETLLMAAASNGRSAIAQRLISAGIDVGARDETGETALMKTSVSGDAETVELLLKHGADIDAVNKDNMTLLMSAVIQGRESLVQLLVESGADVSVKSNRGETAIDWADKMNQPDMKTLLVNAGKQKPSIDQGRRSLGFSGKFQALNARFRRSNHDLEKS